MADYFNRVLHTDINPYESVRKISDKTYEIRAMDAVAVNTDKLEFHVGGFMAHCSNQSKQEWEITSNESNPVFRVRLHKDGWFRDKYGNRYFMDGRPQKFYDYNF